MKKIITICACIVASITSLSAQIEKGDMLIKGSIGYNSLGNSTVYDITDEGHSNSLNLLNINPQFERFISDRSSLGISVGFVDAWIKRTDTYMQDNTSKSRNGVALYYVGPTYNYYIPLAKKFYLSINCFLGYAGANTYSISVYDGEKEKQSSPSINMGVASITPMLNYFINNRWALTASFGNASLIILSKAEGDATTTTTYGGINWGQVKLGVGFKF